MKANDSKSSLSYLNKLVDQYNKTTYGHSIGKRLINPDYSALTENIEMNHKAPKFKINESKLLIIRIFLVKVTPKTGQEKNLLSVLC